MRLIFSTIWDFIGIFVPEKLNYYPTLSGRWQAIEWIPLCSTSDMQSLQSRDLRCNIVHHCMSDLRSLISARALQGLDGASNANPTIISESGGVDTVCLYFAAYMVTKD